jgi:hypothetical protein
MTVIVVTNTVALVLLAMLVVGLLRSHAEILRRLGPEEEHGDHAQRVSSATSPNLELIDLPGPRDASPPASDIVGETTFLSSGCLTCMSLWDGIAHDAEPLPGNARIVVVTKGRSMESPSRLRELAPGAVPVVMSQEAWEGYGIAMSPYFVYVDGRTGAVRSEGAASSWEQVRSLLRDAMADEELARRVGADRG